MDNDAAQLRRSALSGVARLCRAALNGAAQVTSGGPDTVLKGIGPKRPLPRDTAKALCIMFAVFQVICVCVE